MLGLSPGHRQKNLGFAEQGSVVAELEVAAVVVAAGTGWELAGP